MDLQAGKIKLITFMQIQWNHILRLSDFSKKFHLHHNSVIKPVILSNRKHAHQYLISSISSGEHKEHGMGV